MTDTGNMYMPVAPANGGGFGGDWAWIILLLLLGWGGGGANGNNGLFPWMNQSNQMSNGFQNQFLNDGITSLRDNVNTGFNAVEQGANARQVADMQTAFATQNAITQGFFGIQGQLSQCCCDNRLATVQTQNIVQSEGAATRLAIQNQTQQILDKLCQQEIDALKAANVSLQNQLNMANLAASQTAQTIALEQYLKPASTT